MSSAEAVFRLDAPLEASVLSTLRSDVESALAAGVRRIVVEIDGVGTLEVPVISALIVLLREARECGADVVLRAQRKSILETLRITALDRVFVVEDAAASAPVAAVPPRLRRPRRRLVASIAAAFFAALGVCATDRSVAADFDPQTIVRNITMQNSEMRSYESQVAVDFHLRSFPYVSQHLSGTTYFKRPDNFEVVFDAVPSYAKGFDKLYSDIDDPTGWSRRFDLALAGERNVAGHRDVVLRLVQKVRGMIDHQDVAIDPTDWHIDGMEWHYYNGGEIAMTQEYQSVGGFTVLAKQHATIRIPFVHAAAEATYSGYRTNVAIDDSVFTGSHH